MIPFAASMLLCIVNGEENFFSAIDDVAYRKMAEENRATDIGNMQEKWVKIALVVPEISCQTDTQTDRHTHDSTSQPLSRAK